MKRNLLSLSLGATTTPRAIAVVPYSICSSDRDSRKAQPSGIKVRFRSAANAEDIFDFTQFVNPSSRNAPALTVDIIREVAAKLREPRFAPVLHFDDGKAGYRIDPYTGEYL